MNTVTAQENKSWFSRQVKFYEESFFGIMPMMMVAQSCLGSIAAFYALKIERFEFLTIATILTMATNSAFLAQIKSKWAVVLFGLSIVVNIILVILSTFLHLG